MADFNSAFTSGIARGYGFVDQARRNRATDEFIGSQRERALAEQKRADEERQFFRELSAEMLRGRDAGYGQNEFSLRNAPAMPPTNQIGMPGQGEAPAGLRPIPPRDARTEEERAMDMSRAAIDFAQKRGRGDVALDLYLKSAPTRERVREQAINRGWAAYRGSGDPNALLAVANRYVMDGANFESAQAITGPGGQKAVRVRGVDPNGKTFDEVLPPAEFERRVQLYMDPDGMRARELQRLQAEAALQGKIAEARGTRPKDFVLEADPEKRVIAFTPEGPREIQTPGLKPQVLRRNMGEGMPEEVTIVNGGFGGAIGQGIGGAGQGNPIAITPVERKMLDKTVTNINSLMGTRLSGGIPATDDDKALHQNAIAAAGALIQANSGNNAVDEATLADVSMGLASGKLKPTRGRLKATGDIVDAVQLPDGRVIYTNPVQIRNALSRMRSSAPGLEPVDRGSFPKVSPGEQKARDAEAARVLEGEISKAKSEASAARARSDKAIGVEKQRERMLADKIEFEILPGLQRELARMRG